jgi:hypothetical protein
MEEDIVVYKDDVVLGSLHVPSPGAYARFVVITTVAMQITHCLL